MPTNPPRTTWLEISRSALTNNVRQLRSLLTPATQLMAVVKANAYGHGAAETSRIIQRAGADRFAVATLGEAIELRAAGIERPILVLGYTPAWQAAAAWATWLTERFLSRRSAAWPWMCSEFLATPLERARSIALVSGLR